MLDGGGLFFLVERHHDDRRAVALDQSRAPFKLLLTLFKRDRVHHTLALDALQPCFDDVEIGAVDHNGKFGNVRLGGDVIQKLLHRRCRVEHPFVHVDIDDIGAAFDLFSSDGERFFVILFANQASEFPRTGDIGSFTDDDEIGFRANSQALEPTEMGKPMRLRRHAGPALPWTASAIALICSGVVPQQPPTKFNHPSLVHAPKALAISSGPRS